MTRQLTRLSGLIVAVLTGCLYMAVAGAADIYLIINGAALACAIGLTIFLRRPGQGAGTIAFTGLALAFFVATLGSSAEIDGVHRWIAVGPVRLHMGLLLLPAIVSLLPDLRSELALLTVIAIGLTASLQPDKASAFALLAGMFMFALAIRDKWSLAMLIIAAIGFLSTLGQIDPLQPVPFVEHVIIDAWESHPSSALMLLSALFLALAMPMWGRNFRNQIPLTASLATISGFVTISFLGPYPTPLIGYGASAIIGYGLALGFSTVRDTGARVA